MGKDNIIFHSIILPSILLGKGELNLPHNIPANEYLNLEGLKLSSSRNWALWVNELSDIYEPDSIRYSLASNFPETSDTDFSKDELVRSNNQELVAAYGNLVNRIVNICVKNFDSKIPKASQVDDESQKIINMCHDTLKVVKDEISNVRLRKGLSAIMKLSGNINLNSNVGSSLNVISNKDNEVVISYEKNKITAEEIINLIQKQNAKIIDISTDDGDLEDVFIRLTKN